MFEFITTPLEKFIYYIVEFVIVNIVTLLIITLAVWELLQPTVSSASSLVSVMSGGKTPTLSKTGEVKPGSSGGGGGKVPPVAPPPSPKAANSLAAAAAKKTKLGKYASLVPPSAQIDVARDMELREELEQYLDAGEMETALLAAPALSPAELLPLIQKELEEDVNFQNLSRKEKREQISKISKILDKYEEKIPPIIIPGAESEERALGDARSKMGSAAKNFLKNSSPSGKDAFVKAESEMQLAQQELDHKKEQIHQDMQADARRLESEMKRLLSLASAAEKDYAAKKTNANKKRAISLRSQYATSVKKYDDAVEELNRLFPS
jgi:hypothetical protein